MKIFGDIGAGPILNFPKQSSSLGGFVDGFSDGETGPQHLWNFVGTALRLLKQPNMEREQAALGSFQEPLRVQDSESTQMRFLKYQLIV